MPNTPSLLAVSFALVTSSVLGASTPKPPNAWTLEQRGVTGVSAMQLTIVSPTLALIFDKVEGNPLTINGHPAWGTLLNMETSDLTPLDIQTNTFCAGGTFISNGTMVSIGGNSVIDPEWGDEEGRSGIRFFAPCLDPTGKSCTVFEDPTNIHLATPRWYPTSLRIYDGSAIVLGGALNNTLYNNVANNTPSYEFFPPKDGGVPRHSQFLVDTLPANLFPLGLALPDGTLFVASNNRSIIYDIDKNIETSLPPFPLGVRASYPFSASATLLPLHPPDYIPEILICGGSTLDDDLPLISFSTQDPASNFCLRMTITEEGIKKGWEVDQMPQARSMPDTLHLPNGKLIIVNGAQTGIAGYNDLSDLIGESDSDNPATTPVLYDPSLPLGSRFSQEGMPTSPIGRLYHSSASFTPNGSVILAGSNPNVNFSTVHWATEYRVEYLNPPWNQPGVDRPEILEDWTDAGRIGFGEKRVFNVNIPSGLDTNQLQVALMDLGFSTHATHSSNRLVFLVASVSRSHGKTQLTVTAPPSGKIYPPGPGYIFLTVDGVVSKGVKVMIGPGGNPPVTWQ